MSKSSFSEIIKGDQPVLIDFHATWCQPCHMLAPIIQQVSKKLTDVKVVKIDIDKNRKLAQKYQIKSVPTMMLFHQGRVIWRKSGVMQEAQLINTIRSMIAKSA